ncbi:unnamed protein product [Prorocentrum cordatum]|uniref:Uncharacterized protein n=1 Tax=Prorocentrum cordatum TaxID=2364126 RepID=A0ABN9RAW8_9DINO|nr:unnamed protein product [Polarella glacialis]
MYSAVVASLLTFLLTGAIAEECAPLETQLFQAALAANASADRHSRRGKGRARAREQCTVCPDVQIFNDCPGNGPGTCASAGTHGGGSPGCEWCPLKNECRVKCTCHDDSPPARSLFEDCNYSAGVATQTVSYWPPVLAPSYTSYYPECECESSGQDDPHMTNMYGQRFDLMQPGVHVLLRIPQFAKKALLRVDAKATHLGAKCEDMYFTAVNFTGTWVVGRRGVGRSGVQFLAGEDSDPSKNGWWHFKNVGLKVVHSRAQAGPYLNFHAKHLRNAGYAVGGLLGGDDHTEAATKSPSCRKTLSLLQVGDGIGLSGPEGFSGSKADASL